MALSEAKQRVQKEGLLSAFPVKAGVNIFKGALVKIGADGFLAPQAAEAGANHAGVAYEGMDNSNGADGDVVCRVERADSFVMDGTGFVQADVGKLVYASDDDTVSITQGTNEMAVGVIEELLSATQVYVKQLVDTK